MCTSSVYSDLSIASVSCTKHSDATFCTINGYMHQFPRGNNYNIMNKLYITVQTLLIVGLVRITYIGQRSGKMTGCTCRCYHMGFCVSIPISFHRVVSSRERSCFLTSCFQHEGRIQGWTQTNIVITPLCYT
jgi:hypothetical protein